MLSCTQMSCSIISDLKIFLFAFLSFIMWSNLSCYIYLCHYWMSDVRQNTKHAHNSIFATNSTEHRSSMAEATTKEADAAITTDAIGGGKFVGIGIFLFTCLGLCLVYPYNTIISATDWFVYIMPHYANIAGVLANMNFVASVVRISRFYMFYIYCYCASILRSI